MGTYNIAQIGNIINKRPNKERVEYAQKVNKKLMLHVHGVGMHNALAQMQYFENNDIYKARRDYAISNKDMFARLLQEEEQIFTTRGGSSYFNLPEAQEKEMNMLLSDVVYGQSLRKWVANLGINAYRADPMGVIFMEVEKVTSIEGVDNITAGKPLEYNIETPKCYPTYKSSQDIWEYQCNGRKLDYICFSLTKAELIEYGIQEETPAIYPQGKHADLPINKQYFRWVDDSQDVLVQKVTTSGQGVQVSVAPLGTVEVMTIAGVQNPIKGLWNKVPAFIVSDLIKFTDAGTFDSPLNKVVELADCFLYDRSIRDLQKKYHGFAKAIEPLLQCTTCGGEGVTGNPLNQSAGEGVVKGVACPDCTIPGQTKGTGYKLQTKISDVAKFPLSILGKDAAPHFDFKKIYGYVTPDIESWNKQDDSLSGLEALINITYWSQNKNQIQGFNGKQDQKETATKTISDLQGKYARLNMTADWAEQTERMIANFIGEFWFTESYKGANISYGRNYILEDADTILDTYYNMKANGVPDSMLDNQYEKYISVLWQSNPLQMIIYLKKFDVEPFPHLSGTEVEASPFILEIDKICKRYFGEWDDTIKDNQWAMMDIKLLRQSLIAYATDKNTALTQFNDAAAKKEADLNTKTIASKN